MCFGAQTVVPPSNVALKIGEHFRVSLIGFACLPLLLFLSQLYWSGIFDILTVVVGYLAIKNPEGYNYGMISTFVCLCFIDWGYSFIRILLFFGGGISTGTGWQYSIGAGLTIISPFVYSVALYYSYALYKELRRLLNEMAQLMQGGMVGGDQQMQSIAPSQGQENESGLWQHPETHPSDAPVVDGFRAFTGTGHRLN